MLGEETEEARISILKLIQHILNMSMLTLGKETDLVRDPSPDDHLTFSSLTDEMLKTGVCFPGRPAIAVCHTSVINHGESSSSCQKNYSHSTRLGAGVVLFWCEKHRTCIGWVLLPKSESCEIVFTTLVTRFPILPKIIVYDNACNLSDYCLNRAPSLFKDSIFLVDAFHFAGHINCSLSFNTRLSAIMFGKASVLHEQKNSILAKNKVAAMFMRFDTFMFLLRGFTSIMNQNALNSNLAAQEFNLAAPAQIEPLPQID